MKNLIIIAITTIGLMTACTQAPTLKTYTLDVPKIQKTEARKYTTKVIKVTYPQSLREEMSQKMNFSYSLNDRGTYLNSQWSNHISKLLQGTFIDVLDSSHLFKAVLSDTSTLQEDYRLESNIFAFEHRVRGTLSYAVVSIQFTMIDAHTGELIKSKRFSYQEATLSTNAKGYAEANNRVINSLSHDLIGWIK